MWTLKNQKLQHERWCFFFFSPLPSIWFVSWLGWCDPQSDHHHLALARPTMKCLPAQQKVLQRVHRHKNMPAHFRRSNTQRRPIFVEIKWQTMGDLSSRSVLVKTTKERERAFQHVIDRPSKKANKRKSTLKFRVLPFRFLFCWAFVCVVFVFLKEKNKQSVFYSIYIQIFSELAGWLAGCCCPFGEYG